MWFIYCINDVIHWVVKKPFQVATSSSPPQSLHPKPREARFFSSDFKGLGVPLWAECDLQGGWLGAAPAELSEPLTPHTVPAPLLVPLWALIKPANPPPLSCPSLLTVPLCCHGVSLELALYSYIHPFPPGSSSGRGLAVSPAPLLPAPPHRGGQAAPRQHCWSKHNTLTSKES